jgi:hypothetical protein
MRKCEVEHRAEWFFANEKDSACHTRDGHNVPVKIVNSQ